MSFKDNPAVYLVRKTWQYSKGNRHMFLLYVFMFIIANSITFLEPLIVAKILDIVQEEGLTQASFHSLLWYSFAIVLMYLGFWAFHGPARVIEKKNAFIAAANFKKFLMDGTMELPLDWHNEHHSGDTIDKIEKSTQALKEFASVSYEVIEFVVRFVSSYIALAYFNLHSSYLVLLIVIITATMIIRFDKVLSGYYTQLYKIDNSISAKVYDSISNITTVVILRLERIVSSSIYKKVMEPLHLYDHSNKLNETKWFLVSVCSSVMTFAVLSTYFYFGLKEGAVILAGTVYILYGYVTRISNLFFRFAYRYGDIVKWKMAVLNVDEVSDEFKQRSPKYSVLGSRWKALNIERLDFSYHVTGENLHLEDVNLIVKRGEKIALVGESGSGKTTLLKVMRELYRPKAIRLSLDGRFLPQGFVDISEDVSLIPQESELFTTTIFENITMGSVVAYDKVMKYTDMACFTDVAERLPKKFESSISEKGVNLSGGEKQRLALARGLLASEGKSIILLDEPTSSVDVLNELKIFKNIFREFRTKTIISSVHRLHLLVFFDKIVYFRGGRIVAQGTLPEVLEDRQFRKVWDNYNRSKKLDMLRAH